MNTYTESSNSSVTTNIMTGGMISNIGAFIKKNAVMLGIGAAGVAGAIYLMSRKKKSRLGLSGLPKLTKMNKRKTRTTKRLKPIKLS
jgi:hypothetical protein